MKFSIIASSLKPIAQNEYSAHQKAAVASWLPLCDNVTLFNKPEDIGGITPVSALHPMISPPTIREMLVRCMERMKPESVIAIVNSDIVLTDGILRCLDIAKEHNLGRSWAATSFRYEGEPAEVRGQGLDVFVLSAGVLPHIIQAIPQFMTIGRPMWDNWMNGWLKQNLRPTHYFDMTPWKCVFHPIHEGGAGERLGRYTDAQVNEIFSKPLSHGIPDTKY